MCSSMTSTTMSVLDKMMAEKVAFTGQDVVKAGGQADSSATVRESFNGGGGRWEGWASLQSNAMPANGSFRAAGPVIYVDMKKIMRGEGIEEFRKLLQDCNSPWEKLIPALNKKELPKEIEEKVEKAVDLLEASFKDDGRHYCPAEGCSKSYSRARDLAKHVREKH